MVLEVLSSRDNIIFLNGAESIWTKKVEFGKFSLKEDWSICTESDLECVGSCFGILGVIKSLTGSSSKLLLIKKCTPVGELPTGEPTFRIDEVSLLELSTDGDVIADLRSCLKHSDVGPGDGRIGSAARGRGALIGSIKSATSSIKTATVQAAAIASQVRSGAKKDGKDASKLEKRLSEEILRLFNGTKSFYFSLTGDMTKSVYRRRSSTDQESQGLNELDDNFFWNKSLLSDADVFNIESWRKWFTPVIQGYFETAAVPLFPTEEELHNEQNAIPLTSPSLPSLQLTMISRRSRYRCGTRYLRRGVDENGYVANYVETEQILQFSGHVVSFVQVRGSVPVFWSQPGYKYRPPPQLDKDEAETQQAFKKHFDRELSIYRRVCIVSLTEKLGKEKIVGDAYEKHILKYDSPDLTYATFDFHDHCRGLHFENVSLLVDALEEEMKLMRFTWFDSKGTICEQTGTFRVNCMDCLDRTNVVQMAFARRVLLSILSKLGVVPPEGCMPENLLMAHQQIWANNGDVISKQYAGTNALKGDFTRTGKRKFAGMMKDGMNSASRFYINRFRDAFRQVAISILTGESIPNDLLVSLTTEKTPVQEEPDVTVTAERVKQVIEDCRNLLLSDSEVAVGSWGVIDSHPARGDPMQTDMDQILVITQDTLYVIDYDDDDDELERYYPIPFSSIETVEFGPDVQSNLSLSFLRSSGQRSRTNDPVHHLRISYKIGNKSGYLVQCRSTKLRFFNNMAIPIKSEEEMIESLRAICETIVMTLEVHGFPVPVFTGPLVKRKGSVPIASGIPLAASTGAERSGGVLSHLGLSSVHFPTDNQMAALVDAGSKAFISVTQQFSKLSPSSIRRHLHANKSEPLRSASAMAHRPPEALVLTPSRPTTPDTTMNAAADDLFIDTVGILAVHKVKIIPTRPVLSPPLPARIRSPMLKDTRRTTSFCENGLKVTSRSTTPHRSPDLKSRREPTPEILISSPMQMPKAEMILPLRDLHGGEVGSRSSTPGSAILSALASPLGKIGENIAVLSPSTGNPLTKIARGVQNLGSFDLRRSRQKIPESPEIRKLKNCSKTRFVEL